MIVESEVSPRPLVVLDATRAAGHVIVSPGFAVWGLSIMEPAVRQQPSLTHYRRCVLDHGIPHHDVYSFTAVGEPWVVQSWLASVLYGWIDSWFGVVGLRLLMAALTGVLGAMVWRLTRPARSLAGRIVIAGCVLGVGSSVWSPRPLLIGLVLLTWRAGGEARLDPRWMLPVFCSGQRPPGSFRWGSWPGLPVDR